MSPSRIGRACAFVSLVLMSLSIACGATVIAPEDFAPWNAYPDEATYISGPTPRFIAFLAPFDQILGVQRSLIVATNSGSTTTQLSYGPCSFGLRLYTTEAFNTPPVWDNRRQGCDLIRISLDIPPGETRTRPMYGFIWPDVLADRLPPRWYYAAVTWRSALNAPVQVVPAGSIYIGPPRLPQ
jgi:hypothetical protein